MELTTFTLILDTVGTLLIAYAALNVHHRFRKEHKIDEKVYRAMHIEHRVGILGIILIIIAFIVELTLI